MIYLELFLSFLKIGFFSFGGGYGAIPFITEEVVNYRGWLSNEKLLSYIAVGESTPGPFAINIATFVGSSQAGIGGAIVASIGFILPSLIIITIISLFIEILLKKTGVFKTMNLVKATIVGLILATAFIFFKNSLFIDQNFSLISIGIIAICLTIKLLYEKKFKKRFNPLLIILISAILGIILY